jgi:hypothetical protein
LPSGPAARRANSGSADGEAKFWLEPAIELSRHGYHGRHLKEIRTLIEDGYDDIVDG